MASLGERIRARRKELGLTQSQLGGAELTKGFISLVEKGRAKPSLETLILLAQRLQKPVGYFLEDAPLPGAPDLRVALQSGWVHVKHGDLERATEAFSEAIPLAQQQRDHRSEAEGHVGLASALAGLHRFDQAQEHVVRARALAEATGDARLIPRISHVLGLIAYHRGNLAAARDHFLEASRLLRASGQADPSLEGSLLLALGDTFQESGDSAEAVRWYREALAVLEPTEDLYRVGLEHARQGALHNEAGNREAALSHLVRAEHVFELLEGLRLLAEARTSIGAMLLERGEVDEALAHLQASLRLKERLGDDPGRARTLTEMARAHLARRAFGDADRLLAEAEQLADRAEMGRIHLVQARSQRGQGRGAEAIHAYRRAIAVFDELRMRVELAGACNELGEFLLEQKRPSEAAPYLARALQELRAHRASGMEPR